MKLAEALSRRAALMDKVRQLKVRLDDCIKIQEGDTPIETPEEVIAELDKTLDSLRRLIYCINITNTRTEVDGRNITSLLAERDTLKLRVTTLADSLKHLTEREDRYNRSEIRYVRTVDAGEFRKLYDKCASQLRQLDLKIQSIGWMTELIEEM
ncbi:MAG: DIP1984 family protein [Muribaculum sp.]|nr:DIP1984 family protein [Muribaculum sp.]